jgi:hypothetical protein
MTYGEYCRAAEWCGVESISPAEGKLYFILLSSADKKQPDLPDDEWFTDIAMYSDGDWYKLEYDHVLGIPRKVTVKGRVRFYSTILPPDAL